MKVYARYKKLNDDSAVPFNVNIYTAMTGFLEMGFEVVPYYDILEIYNLYELGDIVLDGVYQVRYCLDKFGIKYEECDYPDILRDYLGRKVWKCSIDYLNKHPELWNTFIKSVEGKRIVGRPVREPKDLIGCGSEYEDVEIHCSDILDIVLEFRSFVLYDELMDLRPYRGNWEYMNKLDTALIKKAMEDWKKWEGRPNACSLDWGITREGKTILIEQNAGYALGCYGLNNITYAKMISACISQLSGTKDECDFR